MKPSRRTLSLLAAAVAVAAVGIQQVRAAATVEAHYGSALGAFSDVCVQSANHGEMLRKVRIKGWEVLRDDAIPAMVQGNGMVSLAEVRRGQIAGQPVILAVGELSGTSFCHVYFHSTDTAAMQKRLQGLQVLGSPLNASDFKGPLNFPEGWSAVGWHRTVGQDWRAVHYSFDPDGRGPNAAWQAIEITRKI
ncbi:hypothetical protein [Caulobacter segnis]